MSTAASNERPRTSVPALAALALGIVALACVPAHWLVAGVLGALAIVVAAGTRRAFQGDDRLRGAGFAGIGFVLGVIAVVLALWPIVLGLVAGAI